jgi:hypothetical protein
MPPGTDLPTSPTPLEDQGQAVQVEPPSPEVQERGIPLKPLPGTALTPSGMAPPPCGDGLPTTANIIKVACAFQVKAKSLTTLVVVAPGQVLTRPVTISIVLGGYCPKVITQSYVASTGNHFLYNDCEGDGKPRRGRVDITLTEPNPAGGVYSFSLVPGNVVLDPLYDVTISPLKFTLLDRCGGRLEGSVNEIRFYWDSPDDQYHVLPFYLRKGEGATISTGFEWAGAEVSASANLHVPKIGFFELDALEKTDPLYKLPPSNVNLVPGKTQTLSPTITDDKKECRASVQYMMRYTLRFYPFL